MHKFTREEILEIVKEEDVQFLRLQFTDVFGTMKNMAVTVSQLEKVLDNQCRFDASPVQGFSGLYEPDLYLHPDWNTFAIFPWRPQQGKVARLICDVYRPDGTPYPGDPRRILKRILNEAANMGYEMKVGPECEFFLFHMDEDGMPTTLTHEQGGYFDVGPLDFGENARRDMVLTLEEMGFVIESSYHESAPAQHEIDFQYDEALTTADNIMTFKMVVKTIAKRHGLHATFMPKPKAETAGSGMHINLSLHKNEKNVFRNDEDKNGLSQEAYYFIGGLMKHIRAITCITNPTVNSYKRFVPGYEAPVYIGWSAKSKSPLLRVPPVRGEHARLELRSPDSTANPYLALAVLLAAGLDGIQNRIAPRESMDQIVSEADREKYQALPENLGEAVRELEKDAFIRGVLGEELAQDMIAVQKKEYHAYCMQVTDWELANYLHRL
ncbi:MAG: type I glutamate--ammonia ligase [Ruminococcus sp.]|nr:type I glutamate--ammonia ligase [Ruminococcus sp.]